MTIGVSVTWDNGDEAVYGPFENVSRADSWIENELPDDGVVDAVWGYVPNDMTMNDPSTVNGDIPDEDIRDDTEEDIVKNRGYLPD